MSLGEPFRSLVDLTVQSFLFLIFSLLPDPEQWLKSIKYDSAGDGCKRGFLSYLAGLV